MEKQNKLIPSLAKGFKDRWGKELALKKKIINTIEQVFINYAYEPLETPPFEKSENIGSFLANDETNPMSDVFFFVFPFFGTRGQIRTVDLRFHKPLL